MVKLWGYLLMGLFWGGAAQAQTFKFKLTGEIRPSGQSQMVRVTEIDEFAVSTEGYRCLFNAGFIESIPCSLLYEESDSTKPASTQIALGSNHIMILSILYGLGDSQTDKKHRLQFNRILSGCPGSQLYPVKYKLEGPRTQDFWCSSDYSGVETRIRMELLEIP